MPVQLDDDSMEHILSEITEGITVREFPTGFISEEYEGDETAIPVGEEVSMYRELEGVFVMIDGQRLFFNNPAYAKFIFYCAKAGLSSVKVPEAKIAKKAVRALEQDVENLIHELESRLQASGFQGEVRKALLSGALKRVGAEYYLDIVSSEDLW